MSDIVRSLEATVSGSEGVSRRAVLQFAGLIGLSTAVGAAVSACAGPQSAAGSGGSAAADGGSISIVLNRNLVSLDNKLNQYDAAVTVQRAVRQALTRIGNDLKPELVLAQSFEQTSPTVWTVTLRDGIHYSDKSPVTVEDVDTALKLYFQVKAGYVASQFPEQPMFAKVARDAQLADVEHPHHAGQGQQARGAARRHRVRSVHRRGGRLGHRHLPPRAQRELLG